jgi:hypothetical protein
VGILVQDFTWPGPLLVLRFVAESSEDLVAECQGWNKLGGRIVRFLVVVKVLVERPEDGSSSVLGGLIHRRLPPAPGPDVYLPRGCHGNYLPLPFPAPTTDLTPISIFSDSSYDNADLDCNSVFWSLLCFV